MKEERRTQKRLFFIHNELCVLIDTHSYKFYVSMNSV